MTYQQRTTQSWVNISRLTGAAADATRETMPGRGSDSADDDGNANQPHRGDRGVQLVGRSRVIHMLWKGFLILGVALWRKPWSRWLMSWAAG
ncbi:hypothetical protein I545_3627 [Mycobacterium kansasii 662]|uniref:Uncharacterized protein n=1 Tax=Mycobacterium kansasii 662 TaxID=1299326 RepID=X7ZDS9_MYCKA|nr:hypothetical protein I545_3627 [Mycobacterium kansasii 662]